MIEQSVKLQSLFVNPPASPACLVKFCSQGLLKVVFVKQFQCFWIHDKQRDNLNFNDLNDFGDRNWNLSRTYGVTSTANGS